MKSGLPPPANPNRDRPGGGRLVLHDGKSRTDVSRRYPTSPNDALRIQVAAVAAQQVALAEEETKLLQQRALLEQQEQQLAAHLEAKRTDIVKRNEALQRDRHLLAQDQTAYERHLQQVTLDQVKVQRDMSLARQKLAADRQRLIYLAQRLRRRWQRLRHAEDRRRAERESELCLEGHNLDAWARRLDEHEAALVDKRLRFNGLYELGRRRLREAWQEWRRRQKRWLKRRDRERAAIKVRETDLHLAERRLVEAQRALQHEQGVWTEGKAILLVEVNQLETRVRNQRSLLTQHRQQLQEIEAEIDLRRAVLERLAPVEEQALAELVKDETGLESSSPPTSSPVLPAPSQVTKRSKPRATAKTLPLQSADLERLVGIVADQRLQLVEAWQQLARFHHGWEADRARTALELDGVAQHFLEKARGLLLREERALHAEKELDREHEALILLRRHLLAWSARLKVQEQAWEGDRQVLLDHVRRRELETDRHALQLAKLRQRWSERRRQEAGQLRLERKELEAIRRHQAALALRLTQNSIALEDEKRSLLSKALAFEQLRQEFLTKRPNSRAAQRRLERLRRRWLAVNAATIRNFRSAQEAIDANFASIEEKHAGLQERTDMVAAAEAEFQGKQAAWEFEAAQASADRECWHIALEHAQEQRTQAEAQLALIREEMERIVLRVLDEPAPADILIDKAA